MEPDISQYVSYADLFIGGAGLACLSLIGAAPRVGIVRALVIGLKSRVIPYYGVTSKRVEDISNLLKRVSSPEKGLYFVVTGEKGLGKSMLIQTALQNSFGVINTSVSSGEDKDHIMDKVRREITNIRFNVFDVSAASTRRVLFFYRLIFRSSPIVVIQLSERQEGDRYASVTAAVRGLVDEYQLRVIVDGTPNSIPPRLLETKREVVLNITEMTRDTLEGIPEFEELMKFLRNNNLHNRAWKILGGSPILFTQLNDIFSYNGGTNADAAAIVKEMNSFLLRTLTKSLSLIFTCSKNTTEIVELFRKEKLVSMSESQLNKNGLVLDYPNEVFRSIEEVRGVRIVPATPALALIIENDILNANGVKTLFQNL